MSKFVTYPGPGEIQTSVLDLPFTVPRGEPITVPILDEPLTLDWVYDDGGRAAAGFKGEAGDCVTRAISIAFQASGHWQGQPAEIYQRAYDDMNLLCKAAAKRARKRHGPTGARLGVPKPVTRNYLGLNGWSWTPTMGIGTGTRVHLRPGELPDGVLIAMVSRHAVAVIDGVMHDTYDPSREGSRAVYGYYRPPVG